MSKNDKKRKLLIGVISGAILLVIIIFLLWFFNRKFDITLDYNDGTKTKIVQIKYNKAINKKDIENTDGLNATWYEVVEKKENEEILAKEPFDFKTKINKNTINAVLNSMIPSPPPSLPLHIRLLHQWLPASRSLSHPTFSLQLLLRRGR